MFKWFKGLQPEVGMQLQDKEFGDSLIEITAISNDGKVVRYRFVALDGRTVNGTIDHRMPWWWIKSEYERVKN